LALPPAAIDISDTSSAFDLRIPRKLHIRQASLRSERLKALERAYDPRISSG
jgi:hypothetical protein